LRALVGDVLKRAGFTTIEADNGTAALDAVRAARPSVVLLDVNIPDGSGYEVCHMLRNEFGDGLPIIFLSGERTEGFDRAAGLMLGADDYLVKPFDPDELVARVRKLGGRDDNIGDGGAASAQRMIARNLTPREREVLRLLVDGFAQDEIASSLYISPKTVATHVQRILGKLGVRTRTQAVALAFRDGLVDRGLPKEA
jgi:DNA-binding NarL/FixJ family response regulator